MNAVAVMAGLCLISGIGAAVAGCGSGSTSTSSKLSQPETKKSAATASPSTAKAAPGLGDAVRDGKFEFVVSRVSCGHSSVGDTSIGLGETAQGQFCLAKMTVKNIGDEAQTFDDTAQLAFDDAGKQYSANTMADIEINSDSWQADINPGNKITGTVVFDIPKSKKIAKLELHDSIFSGGVTVKNS